jgi:hypothetical protein
VHDIFMAHIVLEGSGVMPIVGELVTSGMPEHVRVNREWELGGFSGPSDHLQESCRRGWTASLGDENIPGFHILAAYLTQGSDFLAAQRPYMPRAGPGRAGAKKESACPPGPLPQIGSLAKLTAIRRASPLVISFAAAGRPDSSSKQTQASA